MKWKILFCLFFGLILAVSPANAADSISPADEASASRADEIVAAQLDGLELGGVEKALPRDAKNLLDGEGVSVQADLGARLSGIASRALSAARSYLSAGLIGAVRILGIAALCGIAHNLLAAGESKLPVVTIAGAAALTAAALGDVQNLLGLARTTIAQMSDFSKLLLPILTAAGAAAGSPVSASARHAIVCFLCDVVITAIDGLIIPAVYCYIALITANAISGNESLAKIAGLVKWAVTLALRVVLTLFFAYLALSGAISGATDAIAQKSLKLALSGALPVVGSILGDAAEAVVAGAHIVKNAVGVFGLLALLAIVILPILRIGIQYICYKSAAAFSGIMGKPELSRLVEGIGDAFGLLWGLCGTCALLLLLSTFAALAAGGF